jgi:hypothetical protein
MSLLSTSYKILSNILLSKLIPYADEIIGVYQCGFRRDRSTTDQEKKWEYNGTVHQLFIGFNKAYVSVREEVLYNIFIEFGVPSKLVGLIKMCLNETYRTVHIVKNLSDKFTIQNGLKQGDALSPLHLTLLWNMPSGGVHKNLKGLKLNGTHQVLACVDFNIVGENIDTMHKNTKALLYASKEVGLEVNPENTKYMLMSHYQNAGLRHSIKISNGSFEDVAKFKYLGATLTDQNCIHKEIKRLNSGNACYHSFQSLMSSRLLSRNIQKTQFCQLFCVGVKLGLLH